MTRTYEILFIVRPDYDDEQIASLIARYTEVVNEQQGTVTSAEKWAKRRLAYEIDRVREGIYVIMHVEGPAALSDELDHRMKIDQEILRYMISRIDHLAKVESKPRASRRRRQSARVQRDTKEQISRPKTVVVTEDSTAKDTE